MADNEGTPEPAQATGAANVLRLLRRLPTNVLRLLRRIPSHVVWLVAASLWLGPVIVLLWLNMSGYIIGHSAVSRTRSLPSGQLKQHAFDIARHLDKVDQATLGSLQIAAKALDVWFVLIAARVIFLLTMKMARGHGLPIGYFMTHLHFANPRTITSLAFYQSCFSFPKAAARKRWFFLKPCTIFSRLVYHRLWLFPAYVFVTCGLANIMGPALSMLVIPNLQWKDTKHIPEQKFDRLGLDWHYLPVLQGCSEEAIAAGRYSCTSDVYSSMLDGWLSAQVTKVNQTASDDVFDYYGGLSQEKSIVFGLNHTLDNGSVWWVPNRQVLDSLSSDFCRFRRTTEGDFSYTDYHEYNNSLQTVLRRKGPILGFTLTQIPHDESTGETNGFSVITVADDKTIRCYPGWRLDSTGEYTKCYRIGRGWSLHNTHAQFAVEGINPSDTAVRINVYFSDRSTYFNQTTHFGSSPRHCIDKSEIPSEEGCDWDEMFRAELPENLECSSTNVTIIEYEDVDSSARLIFEFSTYLAFPIYSLDTSKASNPLNLMYTLGLGVDQKKPLVVHPDWILASWSADRDGKLPRNRTATTILSRSLSELSSTSTRSLSLMDLNTYSIGQAMSMVNFTSSKVPNSIKIDSDDTEHPILFHYASINVWAFGLGPISIFAYSVVLFSTLFVILPAVVWSSVDCAKKTWRPSMIEVLAAAFESQYQGEFENLRDGEKTIHVKYTVEKDGNGKVRIAPKASEGTRTRDISKESTSPGQITRGGDIPLNDIVASPTPLPVTRDNTGAEPSRDNVVPPGATEAPTPPPITSDNPGVNSSRDDVVPSGATEAQVSTVPSEDPRVSEAFRVSMGESAPRPITSAPTPPPVTSDNAGVESSRDSVVPLGTTEVQSPTAVFEHSGVLEEGRVSAE